MRIIFETNETMSGHDIAPLATACIPEIARRARCSFLFREHARRSAQAPHGWMSRSYGAGIVDAHELLATVPSVAIPSGFGPLEPPSLLGCPIPMVWSMRFMMAAGGRDARRLSVRA